VACLRICYGCDTARYCGAACQRLHWPRHSAQCKRLQQVKAQAGLIAARAEELGARRAELEALLAVNAAEAAANAAQAEANRAAAAVARAELVAEAVSRSCTA
jgi:Fe-S-cluster containining protein